MAFDYFFVIRNLAGPINNLLKVGYLSSGDGEFSGSSLPYPDADCILVFAICLLALLIVIVDTGVFYQVGVFVYGCGNGLLRLNLGLVRPLLLRSDGELRARRSGGRQGS